MGGNDLNLKKSWHVALLSNQRKVWEAEQSALAERKKIEQVRRERDEERQMEEIKKLQEDHGGRAPQQRVDWMYTGANAGALGTTEEQEAYLLGKRRVDNLLKKEDSKQVEKAASTDTPAASARDLIKKVALDPLLMIEKQREEVKQQVAAVEERMKKRKHRHHSDEQDSKSSRRHRHHRHHRHGSHSRERSDSQDRREARQDNKHSRDRLQSPDRRDSRDKNDSRDRYRPGDGDRDRDRDHNRGRDRDRRRSRSPHRSDSREDGRRRLDRRPSPDSFDKMEQHERRISSREQRRSRSPIRRDTWERPRRRPRPRQIENPRSREDEKAREEERVAKLAAMQERASNLEADRSQRIAEMEKKDAEEREREDKKRGNGNFVASIYKQAESVDLAGRLKGTRREVMSS